MDFYTEPERKIEIADRAEVLVAGGGPAGRGPGGRGGFVPAL